MGVHCTRAECFSVLEPVPSCAKTQLCSAESRSSVDCALRLTNAAGLAGLVPSESLAP